MAIPYHRSVCFCFFSSFKLILFFPQALIENKQICFGISMHLVHGVDSNAFWMFRFKKNTFTHSRAHLIVFFWFRKHFYHRFQYAFFAIALNNSNNNCSLIINQNHSINHQHSRRDPFSEFNCGLSHMELPDFTTSNLWQRMSHSISVR